MHKILNPFFLLLLAVSSGAKAQLTIYNASLIDTSKKVVYIGIDNKLIIAGLKDNSSLSVKSSSSKISPTAKKNEFTLLNSWLTPPKTDTISIHQNGKLLGKMVFEKKLLPATKEQARKILRMSE